MEMPRHQPQQENRCPPHQCNTMMMVMMQDDGDNDVLTIHGGFPPGEPNTTPPHHFPIHLESRCHIAISDVATKQQTMTSGHHQKDTTRRWTTEQQQCNSNLG